MAVFKNKDIDVNVNEKNIDFGNIGANFYTEDVSTSSIRIRIKSNNKIVNLNTLNMTPKLDLFHSDESIFMDEKVEIIIPEEGLIQYKISDQVIKHPGKVNAKLFLKNETKSVHVANFTFNIQDSGITEAVEKEITINLIDDAVRKIVHENAIEILGNDFEQKLNNDVVTHLESKPELFKGLQGNSITVKSKHTNNDGNIIITFSDNTSIEVPKGSDGKSLKFSDLTPSQKLEIKGDTGAPLTVKSKTTNSIGNIVVTFSDNSTIEVPRGEEGRNADPLDVINEIDVINSKVSLNNYSLKAFLNTKFPLQSFIYTDNYIYGIRLEPQKTRTQDDVTLIRFSKNGTSIDTMKILGIGHIENIGYKDEWFYIVVYSEDGTAKKLVKTKYIKDEVIAYENSDNQNLVSLPINLSNEVNKVNVNVYNNIINLMFFNGNNSGITLKSFDLNTYQPINIRTVATEYSLSWLQGCVASDENIYVMIGDHSFGSYKHITSYSIATGDILEIKDVSNVGADDTGNKPINDWLEPEGLQIFQSTNKDTLIQGVFTGGSTTLPTQKRFKLYEWKDITKNQSDYLAFSNHSDGMIFEGSIQGNNSSVFTMTETAKNYKWLTFYYTAGVSGTHTVTIPTDLLKMVKYVDLECDAITNNSEFYKYITKITFKEDLKQFSITTSRMLKVDITDLTKSQTTKDNYAGFYLYKIKGHQLYSEYDL